MALFHKPACENLKKKNRTMARIDNQTDDAVDSMLIYKPKKVKDSSLEYLFSMKSESTGMSRRTKLIIIGIIGVIVWIALVILLYTFIL